MIDNGLDLFMKKHPDELAEEWEEGLNPLYCDNNNFNEKIDVDINNTHLLTLNKNEHNDYVYIDYIAIENPLRIELDCLYLKCDSDSSNHENLNKLLDSNPKFRDVLKEKDFCEFIDKPYQEIESFETLEFIYDENLTDENKFKEIKDDAEFLKGKLKLRDLPYAIEETYKSITDNSVLAVSHRRRGWEDPEFRLMDKFDVQFLTNFGYGRKSYFYVKLKFAKIDIVPFSDWVVYSDGDLYEVIRYSKKLCLINSSWYEAMKYVTDAVNLCIKNEDKFIQKYIFEECELLLNGLEYILNDTTGFPYFAKFHNEYKQKYKFDSRWLLIKYRGEKITGALDFIASIEAFDEITDITSYITRLKDINSKFQPVLLDEIGRLKVELTKAKEDFCAIEPIYTNINLIFKPINKLKNRIDKIIKQRRSNNACDGKSGSSVLEELFNKKYLNYLTLKSEYEIVSSEYDSAKLLVSGLESFYKEFDKYNNRINLIVLGNK